MVNLRKRRRCRDRRCSDRLPNVDRRGEPSAKGRQTYDATGRVSRSKKTATCSFGRLVSPNLSALRTRAASSLASRFPPTETARPSQAHPLPQSGEKKRRARRLGRCRRGRFARVSARPDCRRRETPTVRPFRSRQTPRSGVHRLFRRHGAEVSDLVRNVEQEPPGTPMTCSQRTGSARLAGGGVGRRGVLGFVQER